MRSLTDLTAEYDAHIAAGDKHAARHVAHEITQRLALSLIGDESTTPPATEVPDEPGVEADAPDGDAPDGDGDGSPVEADGDQPGTDQGDGTDAPPDSAPIEKTSDADALADLKASLNQYCDAAMDTSYDDKWRQHHHRISSRLSAVLADRLAFEDADLSGYASGHDSGRLRGRDAVNVAIGSDNPFSQQCVPDAPGRVHIMLAVDASGSMGHLAAYSGSGGTNAFIAHCITDAVRSVIADRPEITMDVCLFGTSARLIEPPHDFDAYFAQHDPIGKGTDKLELAIPMLRDQPAYQQALASRDAIVGICITDACFEPNTVSHCRRYLRDNASCESWLAVLAHGADAKVAADIFGDRTVDATTNLTHAIHSIARAIQSTIERAESIRA
jgi:hypothetical protein